MSKVGELLDFDFGGASRDGLLRCALGGQFSIAISSCIVLLSEKASAS